MYTKINKTVQSYLAEHPKIAEIVAKEDKRQNETIELIASENFPSEAVRAACASSLTNKYAEGYPNHRYYGGCQYVDELEEYCKTKWQEVFKTDYHVNVQPHCGSSANMAAYMAVLKTGDKILSMSLDDGGHLTHGAKVSFSGKQYNIVNYKVDANGFIDYYEDLYNKIVTEKPNLVLAGASAYPRKIDFAKICYLINFAYESHQIETKPYFMVDMAHIAGLVASGDHPTPFGLADIITTTTHKTLRGTRGGLIFCKPELAKKIDSAVFPGVQGGGLFHIIAAKAVTAEEDCTEAYHEYIHNVVANCKAMASRFMQRGMKLVTEGTDNHLLLIDLSKTHPHVTGIMAQNYLDSIGITLNKNMIARDKRKPNETSGLRIGTAAMTTKGYTTDDFIKVADKIVDALDRLEDLYGEHNK